MENYSVEYTAQKLRELCHRAGKYIIGVEPMPYSGIPDVKKGWAVVKAADCDNAKLILDTWHWVRANQPVDISVLACRQSRVHPDQRCMGKTVCNYDFKR